jgi:carbamoyl-phosphate synthase large subunit
MTQFYMELFLSNLTDLQGKRVFVSGAAGVIGMKLVSLLHDYGAIIFAADKKLRPQEWPPEIQYRCGDLNRLQIFEVSSFKPDIYIHLAAAFERSDESSGFWSENFEHNIQLSHHLLDCMKEVRSVKRIIFASSYLTYDQELYMSSDERPENSKGLIESDKINPRNLTGAAKLLHESELSFIQRHSIQGTTCVSARIFRGYGAGSRDVISRWVRAGLAGERIEVYRPEGAFDYIYSRDTAEGLLRLAISNFSGIINLGTGNPRKIVDVLNCLRNNIPELEISYNESESLFEHSYADTSLLRSVLNWSPGITLEEAIPEIIEYESGVSNKYQDIGVLITSISAKIPLFQVFSDATRSVSSNSTLYVGDVNEKCLATFVAPRFWKMPKTEDANLKEILSWISDNGVRLVIPTRDGELTFFARHLEEFHSRGITVLGSSAASIDKCLDKLLFFQELSNVCPVIPTSINLDEHVLGHGPFVVKERFGAGSLSLLLNASNLDASEHAAKLTNPIFQPYIEGREFSIDAFVRKNGVMHGLVIRERILVMNGESQVTKTIFDEQIYKLTIDIAKQLDLRGHFVLQIIKNKDGLHVIECNPRIGGASTLAFAAGLNTPMWSIVEALGEDLVNYPFVPNSSTIQLVRTPVDTIFDSSI